MASEFGHTDEIAAANFVLTVSLFQKLNVLGVIDDGHAEDVIKCASNLLAQYGFVERVQIGAEEELGKLLEGLRRSSSETK